MFGFSRLMPSRFPTSLRKRLFHLVTSPLLLAHGSRGEGGGREEVSSQDGPVGYTDDGRVSPRPSARPPLRLFSSGHPSDATQFKETDCGRLGLLPPPPPTTSSRHFQCNLIGLFGGKFRPFGRYLVIAGVHSLLEPVERVLSAKRTPFCTKCTKRNCKKGEATTCREELCCGWPVPPRWRIALPAPTFSFSFFLSLSFFLFFFFISAFFLKSPPSLLKRCNTTAKITSLGNISASGCRVLSSQTLPLHQSFNQQLPS